MAWFSRQKAQPVITPEQTQQVINLLRQSIDHLNMRVDAHQKRLDRIAAARHARRTADGTFGLALKDL